VFEEACSTENKTAIIAATGEGLICKKGMYVHIAALSAKTSLTVTHGQPVSIPENAPACEGNGIPSANVSLMEVKLDLTVTPPYQQVWVSATPNGTDTNGKTNSWDIKLLERTNGPDSPSNPKSNLMTALMTIECIY